MKYCMPLEFKGDKRLNFIFNDRYLDIKCNKTTISYDL